MGSIPTEASRIFLVIFTEIFKPTGVKSICEIELARLKYKMGKKEGNSFK